MRRLRTPLFQSQSSQFVPAVSNQFRLLLGHKGPYAADREIEFPEELLQQIRHDLRQCEAYAEWRKIEKPGKFSYPRNTFGQCTQRVNDVPEYFCGCCKFTNPEAVLDTLIARHFVQLYSTDLYNGISVRQLYQRELLHSLEDMQTVQEFLENKHEWLDLVARHYSRMHWRAVECERVRMLNEWCTFISYVNSLATMSSLLMNEEQRADTFLQLLPGVPPQPRDGAFLYDTGWTDEIRKAVLQQVEGFFTQANIPLRKQPPFPFPLYHINDSWLLHGFVEPVNEAEKFIADAILKPEKQRRMVNACRNYYDGDEALDLLTERTMLTLADFHHDAPSWSPMESELRVCQEVLQHQAMHTFWSFYRGGELSVQFQRFFVTPAFFGHQVLQALLTQYQFEEEAEVLFTWIRREQLYLTNYNDQTFVLALEASVYAMMESMAGYRDLLSKYCSADRVVIHEQLPSDNDAFAVGYFVILVNGEEGYRDNMEW